ncbi:MAG: hypothetical protein LBD35_01300 [Prevotellaceae bacterium]|nr:hypothetical protein [Prevotellaceae bacterium]
MKHFILFTAISLALVCCNQGGKKATQAKQSVAASSDTLAAFALDSLLQVAEKEIDKTIRVTGYVTHTCKHSGKRCFIVGESQKASMRVEAKGDIGGFNRELVGSKIEVTGVLKERRLTKEYLDKMEQNVEQKKEDGNAETCAAELANISDMRKWMKERGKDYYSVYYMDGLTYVAPD